jgi:beta-galactosidase
MLIGVSSIADKGAERVSNLSTPVMPKSDTLPFVGRVLRSTFLYSPGLIGLVLAAWSTNAATNSVTVLFPSRPETNGFNMGTATRPDGASITVDTYSLRLNGQPWMPVMGEFHFSRYPQDEWREELLKIKAGGVDVVATYVFWIHHEELEGTWDWSGDRDLRRFVQLCGEVGLKAIVRCGPWCHGEVRNGGHPDWLLKQGWKLRSNDTNYLAKAEILYGQIARQLAGLLWKDGGPVIGIQLENEFRGPAAHLMTLKRIAREAGLDVPLYTRTGWPQLTSPMPFGEITPLYGVYAEGFWDRELKPMPGRYWAGFHFSTLRTDANIANEVLGRGNTKDADDVAKYPYLTCEIGGGMMSSYHRRILLSPADIEATTLVKLGSGSTSPGYYMYHGGVNPEGKLTTLNESQLTSYPNDLPVKNYDFQTALGQYGQIRPQYHALRRLHLFLHEWGPQLAGMSVNLPDLRPAGQDDDSTLRWSVRSDGQRGFLFVNNHERLRTLGFKHDLQFQLKLAGRELVFPRAPGKIPPQARFLWPFNLDLGHGVQLAWATAQPVTAIDDGNTRTVFFAETPGVAAEFAFVENAATLAPLKPLRNLKPSHVPIVEIKIKSGETLRIVLLDEADSLALWKGEWQGRSRVFLTEAALVTDGDALRLTSPDETTFGFSVLPAPKRVTAAGKKLAAKADGVFTRFTVTVPGADMPSPQFRRLRPAGPAREIPLGRGTRPVAVQPVDADFTNAAVWRIQLPAGLDLNCDPILHLGYVGDVARVSLNGKLINDDFYNGRPLEIGLRRHAPEIMSGELELAVLPLRKDAPIYLPELAKSGFGTNDTAVALKSIAIIRNHQIELTAE